MRGFARCAAAVGAAAFLLYLPTLKFGFAYDDAAVVLRHAQVAGERWGEIATSAYHTGEDVRVPTGLYRPLTVATLAANHALSGERPASYHLVNVALHALASVLVVALAFELGLTPLPATIGGLAFALHPVHVEVAANVAGRAEALSTALALLALIAYLRGHLATMAVCLGAALFAKENTITLAGVIALWESVRPARLDNDGWAARARNAVRPLAVAAIPIALYLTARIAVLGTLGLSPGAVTPIENPVVGLSLGPRIATVLSVLLRALSLLITPVRLSPDYGYADIVPSPTIFGLAPLLGLIFLGGLVVAIAACRRRDPVVAFCVGSLLLTYSVVSNAFLVIGTVLGDRLLYLPSVFLCVLAGLAVSAAARRIGHFATAAAVTLVLLALIARSASYAFAWRDDAALFAYAAGAAPRSVRALGGYAESLAEQGRVDEARVILDRAIAIAPDFIPNRLNRGAVALSAGDLDAAEADARHVLDLEPGNTVARKLLAATARGR